MNLPNLLTFSRIFLTLVFMLFLFVPSVWFKILALLVFVLATMTDYWDGYFAKKYGQVTAMGQLMDPVADKILTISAFLAFVQMGLLAAWMVVVIIARDLLVTGLRFMPEYKANLAPRSSGKHKTFFQFSFIIAVILFLIARETSAWRAEWTPYALRAIHSAMWLVVVVTVWSGARYFLKNRREFLGG